MQTNKVSSKRWWSNTHEVTESRQHTIFEVTLQGACLCYCFLFSLRSQATDCHTFLTSNNYFSAGVCVNVGGVDVDKQTLSHNERSCWNFARGHRTVVFSGGRMNDLDSSITITCEPKQGLTALFKSPTVLDFISTEVQSCLNNNLWEKNKYW